MVKIARTIGRTLAASLPILVELSALATICAGIGLVSVPAAMIVGGAAVILAFERIAATSQPKPEPRTRRGPTAGGHAS